MKQRLLLLGLSLLSTAILIAVGIGWLRGGTTYRELQPAGKDWPVEIPSALQAYTALDEWATAWSDDYQMIGATLDLSLGAAQKRGWTFMLYSARKGKLVSVWVSDAEIRVLHEQGVLYPPVPIATEQWHYDAPAVFAHWWETRGKRHWREREVEDILITLRQEEDFPLWTMIIRNQISEKPLDVWYLNADTGQILEKSSLP